MQPDKAAVVENGLRKVKNSHTYCMIISIVSSTVDPEQAINNHISSQK